MDRIEMHPVNLKNCGYVHYRYQKNRQPDDYRAGRIILYASGKTVQIKIAKKEMRPGPRFEPGSEDPQSSRMTNYPTPAYVMTVHCQKSDKCPSYISTGLK